MRKLLWRVIAPLIQSYVTERIVMFHEAMVERGQIPEPKPQVPVESSNR